MIIAQLLDFYLLPQMPETNILIVMLHYLLNQSVDHSDSWKTVIYCQTMKALAEYYLLRGSEDD